MVPALAPETSPAGVAEGLLRVLRRAEATVHLVRTPTPEGGWRLTVFGPGNHQDTHDCPDARTCSARALEVEQQLCAQGYQTDARDAA